ncbi:hypothetical protein ACWFRQ_01005 [Streptomyces niveus]
MSGLRYAGPEHQGPVGERVPLDHRDPLKTLRQHTSGQQPGQPGSHHAPPPPALETSFRIFADTRSER